MQGQAWTATAFSALATALLAALLANVSIVGLNQCYDVEIDQLNKPYLPLASGEFSMQTGWNIVLTTGALSLLVSVLSGSLPLIITVSASHMLGIFYSADLAWMRWKRSPLLAAGCILAVRAAFVQVRSSTHCLSILPPVLHSTLTPRYSYATVL
jgi:homogentisate phytyltransferase/homogentisate geranylgeranyltransferase